MRTFRRWSKGAATLAVLLCLLGVSSGTRQDRRSERPDTPTEKLHALVKPSEELHAAFKPKIQAAYGGLPLQFEANQGQTDGQVKFLARGRGYTLFLTATEAVMVLPQP